MSKRDNRHVSQKKIKEMPQPDKPKEHPVIHAPDTPNLPPDKPEVIPKEQPITKPSPEIQQPGLPDLSF